MTIFQILGMRVLTNLREISYWCIHWFGAENISSILRAPDGDSAGS